MVLTEDTKALVDQLRQKYIASLGDKRDGIARSRKSAFAADATTDDRQELLLLIHRISGSAGSYGLDELGQAALELDQLLAACDLRQKLPDVLNPMLDAIIDQLELIIQQEPAS
jgi:HPt (histidine-containing phosphotransfer) domain-containing protein